MKGRSSPSVSTLQRLARALGVSITAYFEVEESVQVAYTRVDERPRIALPRGWIERLGRGLSGQCFAPLLLSLEPGAGRGLEPIVHLGHELAYCLSGTLEYNVDGQVYRLRPGESLLFEAELSHSWRNAGDDTVTAWRFLVTPGGDSGPLDRHISHRRQRRSSAAD